MPTGTKTGSIQTLANIAGISVQAVLGLSGSNSPPFGITAPAGMPGTVTSASGGNLTIADPNLILTVGGESNWYLAIFWLTNSGTVLNACFDVQYSSYFNSAGLDSVTLAGASSTPTNGKYWASSGSLPTSLPANGTPIILAIAQDVSDGVSIPGASGANIQGLIATSNQPGLVEWLTSASGTQERLSAITAAGGFDLWPASSGQLGSLPTGGAANNNAAANGTWSTTGTWAGSGTVTVVRFYNLGASLASFYAGGGGTNTNTAQMQAGALLA